MSDSEQLDYEGVDQCDGEGDQQQQQAESDAEAAADLPGLPAAVNDTPHVGGVEPEVTQGSPAASVSANSTASESSSDSDAEQQGSPPSETRALVPRVDDSTVSIPAIRFLFPATPQAGTEQVMMQPSPFASAAETSLPLAHESDIAEALRRISTHALLVGIHTRFIRRPEQRQALIQWEMESTRAVLQAALRLHVYSLQQHRSVHKRLQKLENPSGPGFCVVHGATAHTTAHCFTIKTFSGHQGITEMLYANPAETRGNTATLMRQGRSHPYPHRRRDTRRAGHGNMGAQQLPAAAAGATAQPVNSELQLSSPTVAAAVTVPAASELQLPVMLHSHQQQQQQSAVMPPPPGLRPIRTREGAPLRELSRSLQSRLGLPQHHLPQQHPPVQHQLEPSQLLISQQHQQHQLRQCQHHQQLPLQHQPMQRQLLMAPVQQLERSSFSAAPAAATLPAGSVPIEAVHALLDAYSDSFIKVTDAAADKVAAANHRAYVTRKDADYRIHKIQRETRSVFERVQQ